MPLFVIHCLDKPDSAELRLATRERHLRYLGEQSSLIVGGPYLSDEGLMIGSMMIVDLPDAQAAADLNHEDPYTRAGLFQNVKILPFKVTVGALV